MRLRWFLIFFLVLLSSVRFGRPESHEVSKDSCYSVSGWSCEGLLNLILEVTFGLIGGVGVCLVLGFLVYLMCRYCNCCIRIREHFRRYMEDVEARLLDSEVEGSMDHGHAPKEGTAERSWQKREVEEGQSGTASKKQRLDSEECKRESVKGSNHDQQPPIERTLMSTPTCPVEGFNFDGANNYFGSAELKYVTEEASGNEPPKTATRKNAVVLSRDTFASLTKATSWEAFNRAAADRCISPNGFKIASEINPEGGSRADSHAEENEASNLEKLVERYDDVEASGKYSDPAELNLDTGRSFGSPVTSVEDKLTEEANEQFPFDSPESEDTAGVPVQFSPSGQAGACCEVRGVASTVSTDGVRITSNEPFQRRGNMEKSPERSELGAFRASNLQSTQGEEEPEVPPAEDSLLSSESFSAYSNETSSPQQKEEFKEEKREGSKGSDDDTVPVSPSSG